jgi:hypothetical protein
MGAGRVKSATWWSQWGYELLIKTEYADKYMFHLRSLCSFFSVGMGSILCSILYAVLVENTNSNVIMVMTRMAAIINKISIYYSTPFNRFIVGNLVVN